MSTSVTWAVVVRRPVAEVAAVATDPERLMPMLSGIGRSGQVTEQEYDMFLDVGTIHVGGRVAVSTPDAHTLSWRSIRGTENDFELRVTEHPDGSLVSATLRLRLHGLVMARVSEFLARGIMSRHLIAGLEQLRHDVEHGS
ncbi:hypothetical protein ncot_14705 [Nocardioides sp. JQ2195]|uniref:SRPBCC family protein n=1 Tax=Nocardioides sp. JQ2195 TaxID=2592334 RepID=UPI00143E653A|nr:SRPBCC family protein [Nocardioides sp. JQ2195]QIX27705.1 hypothetical protein ncot_14705 [Nocardioides sp. JQ2195]